MKPEDIQDAASLKAWLEARPEALRKTEAIWMAFRAAARVFPIYVVVSNSVSLETHDPPGDSTPLPILRCLLIAGVAAVVRTNAITNAATLAYAARVFMRPADGLFARAAAHAAASAVNAATGLESADAVFCAGSTYGDAHHAYTLHSVEYGHGATSYFLVPLRSDAQALAGSTSSAQLPLWADAPSSFDDAEKDALSLLAKDPPEVWDFWLRWWEGVKLGQPLDWGLQEKVALIPDEIWKQGAAAVAEEIARIEADFALGSGLIEFQSQKMTAAARAMAERKTFGHLS